MQQLVSISQSSSFSQPCMYIVLIMFMFLILYTSTLPIYLSWCTHYVDFTPMGTVYWKDCYFKRDYYWALLFLYHWSLGHWLFFILIISIRLMETKKHIWFQAYWHSPRIQSVRWIWVCCHLDVCRVSKSYPYCMVHCISEIFTSAEMIFTQAAGKKVFSGKAKTYSYLFPRQMVAIMSW